MEIIQRRVKGCRAVVMSGTITSGGPTDLYLRGTQLAHEAGAISVVDAQGSRAGSGARGQARAGETKPPGTGGHGGAELKDEKAVMSAMRELCERGAQRVVITAGKEPALAFDGRSFWRVHAPRIEALNPIGSGDAFTAGLVWRLLRGEDLGEACRWGSASWRSQCVDPYGGRSASERRGAAGAGSESGAGEGLAREAPISACNAGELAQSRPGVGCGSAIPIDRQGQRKQKIFRREDFFS